MSKSVRPQRRQPTRHPRPWDSPGKNTGVLAIAFYKAWKWKWSRSVVSDSVQPHGLQPTRLLRPWDFPGKSTGVGCHCLLRSTREYISKSPVSTWRTGEVPGAQWLVRVTSGVVLTRAVWNTETTVYTSATLIEWSMCQPWMVSLLSILRPRPQTRGG